MLVWGLFYFANRYDLLFSFCHGGRACKKRSNGKFDVNDFSCVSNYGHCFWRNEISSSYVFRERRRDFVNFADIFQHDIFVQTFDVLYQRIDIFRLHGLASVHYQRDCVVNQRRRSGRNILYLDDFRSVFAANFADNDYVNCRSADCQDYDVFQKTSFARLNCYRCADYWNCRGNLYSYIFDAKPNS